MNGNQIWKMLEEKKIPTRLINAITSEVKDTVHINRNESEVFNKDRCLKQGGQVESTAVCISDGRHNKA